MTSIAFLWFSSIAAASRNRIFPVQSVTLGTDTTPVGRRADSSHGDCGILQHASTVPWPCVAELYLDGARESIESHARPFRWANGRIKHVFHLQLQDPAGLHRGRNTPLRAATGSKYDDRRCFAVEADRAVPDRHREKRSRQEIPCPRRFLLSRTRAYLPGQARHGGPFRTTELMADELPADRAFKRVQGDFSREPARSECGSRRAFENLSSRAEVI